MNKQIDRRYVLVELIAMRRRLDQLINELTGDQHREFVAKLDAGESMSVRSVRHYDVPLEPPEVVADRWGVDLEAS